MNAIVQHSSSTTSLTKPSAAGQFSPALKRLATTLAGWELSHGSPPATREELAAGYRECRNLLERSTHEAIGVFVDKLCDFAGAFGIKADAKELTKIYADGLIDLPSDLLMRAYEEAVKNWRWGNRLPMPADFRGFVQPELDRRKALFRRMELAGETLKRLGPRNTEPVSDEEKQRVAKMVAEATEQLRAAKPFSMKNPA